MIQFVQILFPSKWGGTKVRNGNFDLFIIFSALRASLSSALPLSLQLVLQLVYPGGQLLDGPLNTTDLVLLVPKPRVEAVDLRVLPHDGLLHLSLVLLHVRHRALAHLQVALQLPPLLLHAVLHLLLLLHGGVHVVQCVLQLVLDVRQVRHLPPRADQLVTR